MAVAFTHLSWWLWSGKQNPKVSKGSSLNGSQDQGLWELDSVNFRIANGGTKTQSPRKIKRKWQNREERKIDQEYDIVLVPPDGGCVSGSESEGSDWSIGWLEPHGPEFQSDDDAADSFAVLVPCYGHGGQLIAGDSPKSTLVPIGNLDESFAAESKKHVEQWLSSLQKS